MCAQVAQHPGGGYDCPNGNNTTDPDWKPPERPDGLGGGSGGSGGSSPCLSGSCKDNGPSKVTVAEGDLISCTPASDITPGKAIEYTILGSHGSGKRYFFAFDGSSNREYQKGYYSKSKKAYVFKLTHTTNKTSGEVAVTGWPHIVGATKNDVSIPDTVSCGRIANPPVATLEVHDDNANPSWQTGSITIDPIDEVSLAWNRINGAPNTNTCSGFSFVTGGNRSGSTSNVVEPTEDQGSKTYRVRCDGAGGTTPAYASVSVSTEAGEGASLDCTSARYKNGRVRRGTEVEVCWELGTNSPEMCSITAGAVDVLSPVNASSGTVNHAVYGEVTFTLECTGGDSDSFNVQVLPEFQDT